MSTFAAPQPFQGIEIQGLGRLYEDHYALLNLNAQLPAGCATALLGPNGAGKSTLIGLLSTRMQASEGRCLFFGRPMSRGGAALRAQIGYLGHRTMLYSDLSARENLTFFGRLYGVPQLEARVERLLAQVELSHAIDRPVSGFSRGMQQRVALARVLLPEPRLLLLDEPLTGLDQAGIAIALDLFSQAMARGAVVLMASHDLPSTGRLCDRALVLVNGRKRYEGPAEGDLEGLYHRSLQARAR